MYHLHESTHLRNHPLSMMSATSIGIPLATTYQDKWALRQSTRSLWPILTLVIALTAASSCTPGPTSVTQVDLPAQLVNNLLFVPVRVGSSEALSFILDTGGAVDISRAHADRTVARY